MSTHPHVPPLMAPTRHPHIPPPMAPTPHPHVPPLVDTTQQPHVNRVEYGCTPLVLEAFSMYLLLCPYVCAFAKRDFPSHIKGGLLEKRLNILSLYIYIVRVLLRV